MKLINWTNGKKTYITIAIGLALGIYQGFTGHDIPTYVYWGLGLLGLGFHRSALTNQTAQITENVIDVVNSVLSQVEVPQENISAVAPGSVVKITPGVNLVVGKPSPTNISEERVTDALNSAQLK